MMVSDKVVIGIDESYKNTGVTVNKNNGEELKVFAIHAEPLENNSLKRQMIKEWLVKIIKHVKKVYPNAEVICIIERIRLQSKGFLNIDYIKSIGALNALIVDTMYDYGIETFSVDTRAWKSAVVGTSKPMENKYGLPAEKYPTIVWNVKNGRKKEIINYNVGKKKKGVIVKGDRNYTYDDDKSDSIAISFYGFTNKPKLEKEH
jgi:hypothetical protein